MDTSIFWILAVASTFGYALQWALLTKYGRKLDALSMSTYRGLSLGISLLPLLFFTNMENVAVIFSHKQDIFIAAFLTFLSVYTMFVSVKILPVGVVTSFRSLFTIFSAIIVAWFLFNEKHSWVILAFVGTTVIGGMILALSKEKFPHLENHKFFGGIFFAIISGALSGVALNFTAKLSRESDPFIAGYTWELSIGIISLIFLLLRKQFFKGMIDIIPKKEFGKIILAGSPTLIGTGSYALASIYGPVGIISAVGVLGIVFTTIFGIILFGERLRTLQYVGMGIIIVGILGIKLI